MTDYSREKGTTNLTDMIDSGYSSIANSPDGKQSSKAPQLSPEVSRPPLFQIPGDLKRFEKDIDQATQDRFHDVTERVQGPLVEDMRKRFEPRDFQPMAMRLLVLGKDYNDAKPHLVVFCPPKTIKRVKKHFTRSQAKAICHPTDPLQISFEVIVIGLPLRLKNAASTVDIYGAANISTLVGWTSSSTLIRVSGETGDRYATMGGVIKIERDDQDFILCGLTAGHILEEFGVAPSFAEQSRHSEVSSDEETDDDEEMLDADTTIHCSNSPPSVDVPANVNIGTSWSKVGKITITGRSDEARNRDWALVEAIDSQFQKTNKVQKCGDFTKDPARELRLFRDKDMGEKFSRRALILTSGSHGSSLRGGYISNLPTMALLPSGTQFVPVYPMTLDDNSDLPDGSSGSWVINESSCEVYGHVVAGDPFGDIFVVPFADTLEDIKCAVGAKAVTLPSDIDVFAHISRDLSQIIPAGANSTSENQQASGKECPSPALCLQTPTSSPPTTPTMKPLEIFSGVYLPRTGSPPPSSNRTRMKCGLPTPETSPQTGSERITRRRSLHDKQTQLGTAFPR